MIFEGAKRILGRAAKNITPALSSCLRSPATMCPACGISLKTQRITRCRRVKSPRNWGRTFFRSRKYRRKSLRTSDLQPRDKRRQEGERRKREGNVTRAVEWFGFKLRLLVDVQHEVSLAYQITDTKAGDGETLPAMPAEAQANLS